MRQGARVSLVLLAIALGGCAEDRCRSEPPSFEVAVRLDPALDVAQVARLHVEVEAGAFSARKDFAIQGEFADGVAAFAVIVGSKVSGSFQAKVTVQALDASQQPVARTDETFDCSGDGCNFFELTLGCRDGAIQGCYSGPTATRNRGVCKDGSQKCAKGTWGPCEGEVLPGPESCNAKDDDCDGAVDEELTPKACPKQLGVCKGSTQACENGAWQSCAAVYSKLASYEATETLCDRLDNDCDGEVDELPLTSCWDVRARITMALSPIDTKAVAVLGEVPYTVDGHWVHARLDGTDGDLPTKTMSCASLTSTYRDAWVIRRVTTNDPKRCTIEVKGNAAIDCGKPFAANARFTGRIEVNSARGWAVDPAQGTCPATRKAWNIAGGGLCKIAPDGLAVWWDAGNSCGTTSADCCLCPEGARTDYSFALVRK